jgi:hypothetical protein
MSERRRIHCFEVIYGSQTLYMVAFESAQHRAEVLAGQQASLPAPTPAPVVEAPAPRARGRPSYDALIDAALAAHPPDPRLSRSAQAHELLRYLAATGGALPSSRCIEEHLRNKSRNKVRRKSPPRKVRHA